eukprot:5527211-Amphidinium_carterae.2
MAPLLATMLEVIFDAMEVHVRKPEVQLLANNMNRADCHLKHKTCKSPMTKTKNEEQAYAILSAAVCLGSGSGVWQVRDEMRRRAMAQDWLASKLSHSGMGVSVSQACKDFSWPRAIDECPHSGHGLSAHHVVLYTLSSSLGVITCNVIAVHALTSLRLLSSMVPLFSDDVVYE